MALTVVLSYDAGTSNTSGARLSIAASWWENVSDANNDTADVRRG